MRHIFSPTRQLKHCANVKSQAGIENPLPLIDITFKYLLTRSLHAKWHRIVQHGHYEEEFMETCNYFWSVLL
ncbi:unnamed protein product [Clavelina lepadiformis]|uniref:Uncharacterized protein n=1 Tax=Clavelina lepadiformis TaxID=159417 RepID=A0ABP0H362_CLALP